MKYLSFLFAVLMMLVASPTKAQSPKPSNFGIKSKKAMKAFLEGRQQEKYRDYEAALASYQIAVDIEPEFGEAWFTGGTCLYVLKDNKRCYEWMEKAFKYDKNPRPTIYFYLAESAFYQEDWAKAKEYYTTFDEKTVNKRIPAPIRKEAEKNRKSAEYAVENASDRVQFDPANLGSNINSQFDEYLPFLTADEQTMFFTARRPGCIGGYNPEYRGYTEDFFYSILKDGEWQPAENLGPPVNTDKNEGAASFSPDGQLVFFTACSRPGGLGDCDLYVSKLVGKDWSKPFNLGPAINTSLWESQPSISGDGRTLYFSSNRSGGYGGLDIWYSKLVNNIWTLPVNMGPEINTKGNEQTPFIHADGRTLYYASDGLPGYGAYDLYLSRRTGDKWSKPENLGYPLNSPESEANIFINAKGTKAYVNSAREGGLGRSDLYVFDLDQKIRPSYLTYVKGLVFEKGSKKPLGSKVTFVNVETGDTIRSVNSNSASGKFLLNLEPGYDYAAFVDKKGYLFESKAFSLKDLRDCEDCTVKEDTYFEVEIELQKLEVGVTVVMNNIFYETGKFDLLDESKSEMTHLLSFLKRNPKVKVEIGGHTDNVGSPGDNKKLSQNRASGVRAFLIEQGISGDRMEAKGYGETSPVDTNETDEGRARNRRTELKIVGV